MEMLTFPQETPLHEHKSSLWTSSQSSNTLATLLNEALIDINALPVDIINIHINTTLLKKKSGKHFS